MGHSYPCPSPLPGCLPAWLPLSACLPAWLPACLPASVCLCLPACLLSACLPGCLCLPACPAAWLPGCLAPGSSICPSRLPPYLGVRMLGHLAAWLVGGLFHSPCITRLRSFGTQPLKTSQEGVGNRTEPAEPNRTV